jgi:crossover junction endodeoxyribonuclease RuvC
MGEGLREAIATFRPSIIALEDVFAARHPRAAFGLGQARGMALLVAAEAGLEVVSYPARTIKQTVVGYGGADKEQVQTMVAQILGLKDAPRPQDAADALAVAICHCHTSTMRRRLKASLGDDCSS